MLILVTMLGASATKAQPSADSANTLRVAIGGDVALNWRGTAVYWKTFPPRLNPLLPLKEVFESADLGLVNLEGVLMRHNPHYAIDRWNLWAPAVSAQVFRPAGISLVGHANNHTFDGRSDGVLETHKHLKGAGVVAFGSGPDEESAERPYIHRFDGECLAIVPATTKLNKPRGRAAAAAHYPENRREDLLRAVQDAAEQCALVLVYIHWGEQYVDAPAAWMRSLAHEMVDRGADAVVGHHSHVLGAVEYYRGAPVVYSMGNLVFSTPDVRTRRTAILVLEFATNASPAAIGATLVPVFIEQKGYMPRLMNAAEGRQLGIHLQRLCAPYGTNVRFEAGKLSLTPKKR